MGAVRKKIIHERRAGLVEARITSILRSS